MPHTVSDTRQNLPSILVRGPAADRLKALVGIGMDLRFVIDACAKLSAGGDAPDPVTMRALWSAAIVAYARCFKSGRRQRMPDDILDKLTADERAAHERTLNERDQHVAHQVSELEQVRVALFLGVGGEQGRAVGIGVLGATRLLPNPREIVELHGLAVKLLREVEAKRELQQRTTLAEAQEGPSALRSPQEE